MLKEKKKHYLSLRWELVRALVPLLVIVTILMQVAVYIIARQEVIDSTDRQLAANAETLAAKINAWSSGVITQVDLLAATIEGGVLEDENEIINYLQNDMLDIAYCDNGIYVVYDGNGITLDASGNERYPEYLDKSWFQFGMGQDQAAFDECSYFEEDGQKGYSVTIARRFQRNGETAGMIGVDANIEGLTQMLKVSMQGKSEQAFLLDSKSNMIIGSTQEYSDILRDNLISDMQKGSFQQRYEGTDDTLFTAVARVEGTPWNIAVCLPRDIALGELTLILWASIIGVSFLLVIIVLRVLHVATRSMKPLTATRDVLVRLTNGDFTVKAPENKRRRLNEITDINENLAGFLDKMRELLRDIDINAGALSARSTQFSDMAGEMNEDAGSQMEAVGNLTRNMDQISESIQQLALHATDLDSLAVDTRDNSQTAREEMEVTLGGVRVTNEHMGSIATSVYATGESMNKLSGLVDEMQKSTKEIRFIADVIMDIATQTNLLSLNASIEAARAGSQGRGFGVVAEEIKHLAESSEQNAGKIGNHIAKITTLIDTIAESTSKSAGDVHTSVDLMEQMEQEMARVTQTIEKTGGLLKEVTANVEQVAEISASIAAISEEQAAGSQEVAATAAKINELVQNTKEKSDSLKEGTRDLRKASEDLGAHMEKFTL